MPQVSLVRRHWIFAIALTGAVVIRVLVMLAFRPVMWFGGDSASYLSTALRLVPDPSRVGGYGFMLLLLRPLHSFYIVATVQHVLGLAIGVLIYLLARRYGLPAWAGTLAALPVFFDAYELQLEQDVLPDVAFAFLAMLALYLVLRSPEEWLGSPGGWRPVPIASAGLALGLATLLWPVGLVLLAILIVTLLLKLLLGLRAEARTGAGAGPAGAGPAGAGPAGAGPAGTGPAGTGWRPGAAWMAVAAALVCGAVPVLGYAGWFDAHEHQFTLTQSDGVFLWSRAMSFADCSVIKPPADERVLCPPAGPRIASSLYIWEGNSPLLTMPGGRFSARTNSLAMDFALRAIAAQPGGYLTAVVHDIGLSFYWDRPVHPDTGITDRYQFADATTEWVPATMRTPGGGTVAGDQARYAGQPSPTRAAGPFASWMVTYQNWVYLRGTLLGLILLGGLAVMIIRRVKAGARSSAGALPWSFAVAIVVVPPLIADFDLRYLVPAIPAACLAAVLAFARPVPATAPASTTPVGAAV
jgi:hypothetical protein